MNIYPIPVSDETAIRLLAAAQLAADTSDHKLAALSYNQLCNLVKDIRGMAQAALDCASATRVVCENRIFERVPARIDSYPVALRQARMLAFARNHDWGHDARSNADGSITVGVDCLKWPEQVWTREFTTVRSMGELRDWAREWHRVQRA